MGCGSAICIVGPIAFTAIVLYGLIQDTDFWPFLPIAVVSWTGVALARKWQFIAGITQIVLGVALPLVFYFVTEAIDPGSFGATLGLVLIAVLCSPPLLVSGIILIVSGIRETRGNT